MSLKGSKIRKELENYSDPNCKDIKKNYLIYFIIFFIIIYQKIFSPFLGPKCRFNPTCSSYSITALKRYGLIKGCFIAIKRICKCHPWNNGGYDPLA